MIRNYLKVALRSLSRHKVISFVKTLGLAVSLACCIVILFLIRHELSYDRFHEHPDQILRVLPDLPNSKVQSLPFPLIPALASEFPEIIQSVRLFSEAANVRIGLEIFNEDILYVDSEFLEIFSFPLAKSIHEKPLYSRGSVILSHESAVQYFGDTDAVGKTIEISRGAQFKQFVVEAVAQPIPDESSISFSFLLPISNLENTELASSWRQFQLTGFVRLLDHAHLEALSSKLPPFLKKYMGIDIATDDYYAQHKGLKFQSLTNYHLGQEPRSAGLRSVVDIDYLYILSVVAICILFIACFNFMLLAIGQSSTRFKEVGVRKVLGAKRSQLVQQFWFEAILLSLVALAAGAVVAQLMLPRFNQIAGLDLSLDYTGNVTSAICLAGLMVLVGITVGSYPAIFISRQSTDAVMKGRQKLTGHNRFTQALIVTQFVLSICLLISATMINRQLHFVQNKDLGFNANHVVVVPTLEASGEMSDGAELLQYYKAELAANPGIINVAGASGSFQRGFVTFSFFTQEDGTVSDVGSYVVDENFRRTMELEIIEGRDFLPASGDAGKSMIVNETFMKDFSGIAKRNQPFPYRILGHERLKIVGVVKDFNFLSLKRHVLPAALVLGQTARGSLKGKVDCILVRVRPQGIAESLDALKRIWQKYRPNLAFRYNFMDEDVAGQYSAEAMWHKLITIAATFAIVIACMGLIGLTSLAVAQRKREIGIRRVFGASVTQLLQLLNRELLILLLTAYAISWPVSYYIASQFLQSFAYKTPIDFGLFIICGLITFVLSALSVNSLLIKAAMQNPVNILRTE